MPPRHKKPSPVKRGAATVGIHPSPELAGVIERRATALHLSKSKFCLMALEDWIQSGAKLAIVEK